MPTSTDATEPDVATFDGLLLLQEDAEGLAVMMRVTESRVTLRSGRSELGAWAASGVSITSLGDGRYEFLAEGDQLLFIPEEVGSFSNNPLISALAPLPPPKRWRIRGPRAAGTKDPDSPPRFAAEEPKGKVGTRRRKPVAVAETETTSSRPAETAPKRSLRIRRVKPKPTAAGAPEPVAPSDTPNQGPPITSEAVEVSSQPRAAPLGRTMSRPRRAWLATIDQARQYDLLGLDRVPVTSKMREQDAHKHSWDHRVSAGFASRHICTICGKVRVSARRSG